MYKFIEAVNTVVVLVHSKIYFTSEIMFTINIVTVHPSVKKKRDGEEFYKKEELILQNISTIVFAVTSMLHKRERWFVVYAPNQKTKGTRNQKTIGTCKTHLVHFSIQRKDKRSRPTT